ncbi:MAG: hypothetical protein QM778_20215 [Myxococcales bacterium]
MKRFAWLSLGVALSLGLSACDDDNGHDGKGTLNPDGGTPENYDDDIARLRGDLDKLGMDTDARLDVLEAPKPDSSCSVGELCVPDGVDLAEQGMQPVIAALCANEIKCCDAGELNWIYGPAVKSEADCVSAFGDLLNRGLINSSGLFGQYVLRVLDAVRALNDTDFQVAINPEGVNACAASIQAIQCPGAPVAAASCAAPTTDPCSPAKLLKGLERAGDTCDPYNAINGPKVPECGEGLACRQTSSLIFGQSAGVCSAKAKAGDRCTQQSECDELYCEFTSGTCKLRAKEGEACAFIDPTFVDVRPFSSGSSGFGTGAVTLVDCEDGFSCDPTSNKCVRASCAAGAYCTRNSQCGTGLVCNGLASEPLHKLAQQSVTFYGLCTPPTADGQACLRNTVGIAVETNCASGTCTEGTNLCAASLKSDGAACALPGLATNECTSGWCDRNSKCAPACSFSKACAAGSYCADTTPGSRCEPEIATTQACPVGVHASCASKFCNAGTCADKKADSASCTATVECAHGWCRSNTPNAGSSCAAPIAENGACDTESSTLNVCAAGLFCAFGDDMHTGTCRKQSRVGEACQARYGDLDCLTNGACTLRHETFLCDDGALPAGEYACR